MPHFIYRLHLTRAFKDKNNWTERTNAIISDHFQYLKKNCDEGKVILAGRTELEFHDPFLEGIVIYSAENFEEAAAFANEDPAVKNEVMTSQVFPFSLAILQEK